MRNENEVIFFDKNIGVADGYRLVCLIFRLQNIKSNVLCYSTLSRQTRLKNKYHRRLHDTEAEEKRDSMNIMVAVPAQNNNRTRAGTLLLVYTFNTVWHWCLPLKSHSTVFTMPMGHLKSVSYKKTVGASEIDSKCFRPTLIPHDENAMLNKESDTIPGLKLRNVMKEMN